MEKRVDTGSGCEMTATCRDVFIICSDGQDAEDYLLFNRGLKPKQREPVDETAFAAGTVGVGIMSLGFSLHSRIFAWFLDEACDYFVETQPAVVCC